MPLLHRNIYKKNIQIHKRLCISWPILSLLYTRSEVLGWRKAPAGLWWRGCGRTKTRDISHGFAKEMSLLRSKGTHPSHGDGLSSQPQAGPSLQGSASLPDEHLRSSRVVRFAFCPLWAQFMLFSNFTFPSWVAMPVSFFVRQVSEIGFIFIIATIFRLHKHLQGCFHSGDSPLSVLERISVYHSLWRGRTNSGSFVSTLNISQGVLTLNQAFTQIQTQKGVVQAVTVGQSGRSNFSSYFTQK